MSLAASNTVPVEFTSSPGPARTLTPMSSFLSTTQVPPPVGQYGAAATGSSDQTSPEAFRQSIALARDQLANLQNLAQNALYGVENAYQPGMNPAQTSATVSATVEALKSMLEFLRQTGVGALPMVAQPSEQALLASTNAALSREFERNTRVPESAGVVANMLLSADRHAAGSPTKRARGLDDARTPAA